MNFSGKSVLNQKSELQKALEKHKDNIAKKELEHNVASKTPELEKVIADRAKRLQEVVPPEIVRFFSSYRDPHFYNLIVAIELQLIYRNTNWTLFRRFLLFPRWFLYYFFRKKKIKFWAKNSFKQGPNCEREPTQNEKYFSNNPYNYVSLYLQTDFIIFNFVMII